MRQQSYASGELTAFGYDANGNLTSVTRPLGNASTRSYDAANRLVGVTTSAGSASLAYDGNGNLQARIDANGHKTGYAYDARNRRTLVTHADGAKEATTYDGNGNPASLTDARGNVITYTHDARNRVTLKSYGQGSDGLRSLATTYDGNGNRTGTRIEDAAGTRTHGWTYDAFDRPVGATDPWGQSVSHSYDAAGNRTSTGAQGSTTRYSIDALNRRTGLLAAAGAVSFDYDRSGLPTHIAYPDGSQTRTEYDGAGRVIAVEHSTGGSVVSHTATGYDANGNRSEEIVAQGGQTQRTTYAYDGDDRLTQTDTVDAAGSRQVAYTLDGAGNRSAERHLGSGAYAAGDTYSRSYAQNARNQTTAIDQTGGARAGHTDLVHDADGHLTQSTGPEGDHTYAWNARGQLIEVRRDGTRVGQYRYDADGLREEKIGAQTRRTHWIDGFAALDTDAGGQPAGRYEVGPNGRSPVLLSGPGGSQALHADALGSITLVSAGAARETTTYDAWGNAQRSGASGNKFGYTGHQPDEETGLVYFKARYYDPRLGRFISADPLEGELGAPLTWTPYLYANANPLVYVDRNGMYSVGEFGDDLVRAAGGLTGAALGAGWIALDAGEAVGDAWAGAHGNWAAAGRTHERVDRLAEAATHPARTVERVKQALEQELEGAGREEAQGNVFTAAVVRGKLAAEITLSVEGGAGAVRGAARLASGATRAAAAGGKAGPAAAPYRVVPKEEVKLTEGSPVRTAEGGGIESTGQLATVQRSAVPERSTGEEAAARAAQVRAEGQVTADVAAKGVAPGIKAGAAGGETAGKAFPQAIKDAANAENPLKVCVYCQREGVATQVDHAIPKARGGNATLDNAQRACPHCNASKGARDFPVNPPPDYFGQWPPSHW